MLKRDSIWLGLLLGITLPAVCYLIIHFAGRMIEPGSFFSRPFQGNKPMLFSLLINLVILRINFVNLKMDKTGRGILLATFIIVLAFFIFVKNI